MSLLKNIAQPEKRDIVMKNGNESRDVLCNSRKCYRGPWAEIGKYWPGKEPIRLQDSLPCPLEKKIVLHIFGKVDPFHSLLTLFLNDTFSKFFSELHIAWMQYVIFPVRSYALTSRCNVRPYRTQRAHRNEKWMWRSPNWSVQKRRMRY